MNITILMDYLYEINYIWRWLKNCVEFESLVVCTRDEKYILIIKSSVTSYIDVNRNEYSQTHSIWLLWSGQITIMLN